jgi:hypothetical protein
MAPLALTVLAFGAAMAPVPPALVERYYATGFYQRVQPVVTGLSNQSPVALLDLLIVSALALWCVFIVRDVVLGRGIVVGLVFRMVKTAAALYLVFLAMWGLNYRRVPLAAKLRAASRVEGIAAARDLAAGVVVHLNQLHARSHAAPGPKDSELAASWVSTSRLLGHTGVLRPGRPKASMLEPYFRAAGVSGMTDPFFLETLVASGLLDVERPFVVAHEWSHLAGFADEGEANFVGWLSCIRASPVFAYSGWLFLYEEVVSALPEGDRAEVSKRLGAGPRSDLQAIAARVRRDVNPRIANAGWQVYDSYLKSNRVEAGAASYGQVVSLILQTRFGENWTPLLRSP